MKNLICAKDVEAMVKQGGKVLYAAGDTIITPSARDVANANGIEICTEPIKPAAPCKSSGCSDTAGGIDSEMIYNALKVMMEKGMLSDVLDGLVDSCCDRPAYLAERDPVGFKLVRGNSARMDVLDTGNPNDKAFYQELIGSSDRSSMNAGFMTIEKSNFDWDVTCEEIYYIIEGTLTVTIDGKTYTAKPGDSLYAPKGAKVTWGSPDKVKVFYATC